MNKNLKKSILKINNFKKSKIITFNNSKINNALNYNTLINLKKEIINFNQDDSLYNLVIEGSNNIFSSGMDIKEIYYNNDKNFHHSFFNELFSVCHLLQNSEKNTISYINGISHGGANLIAFNCKYSIANEFSNMAFSGCKVGFTGFSSVFNNPHKEKLYGFFKFLNLTGLLVSPSVLLKNDILDVYSNSKYINKVFLSYLEKDITKEDIKNFSVYHNLKDEIDKEKLLINNEEFLMDEKFKNYVNKIFSLYDLRELIESLLLSNLPKKDLIYEEILKNCPLSLYLTNIQFNTYMNTNKKESLLWDYNLFNKMIDEGEYLLKFEDFVKKNKEETIWKYKFNDLNLKKIIEFFSNLNKELIIK